MLKKLILILGILAIVVLVPLLRTMRGGSAVEVEVETLEPRAIQSSVLASGRLVHEEQVKLTTEEIGRVTAIHVVEGDRVQRGQLVLQIDDQRLRAAVQQNEAAARVQEIAIQRQQLQVESLRKQWERMRELHQRKLIDDDSFTLATDKLDIAQVELNSSHETLSQVRAQLEQAQDRLRKTSVYAPIDGTVTTLDIKVGETAISSSTNIPGSSLMTIANPQSILTVVNVDEADISRVEIGQNARVYTVAYPEEPIAGTVHAIAESAKVAEGQQGLSFAVKIQLAQVDAVTLRPGMSCRAEIFSAARDSVLAAPIQAILVEEDLTLKETKRRAFVNRDGKAVRVEVEVGLSDDTYQEITAGLAAQDAVIVGPDRVLRALKDGDKITVKKRE